MIMMGACVSCIILTFITAIQHLHVTGVSIDAALCLDLIVQQRVTSHHTDQTKTTVLLHRCSTAWGTLVTSSPRSSAGTQHNEDQSQTKHDLKQTWLCRPILLTLHRQMMAAPLILLLHD